MLILIPTPIIAIKEAAIGKVIHREGAFLSRVRELFWGATRDRHGINIEDPALVVLKKDFTIIGRESGSANADGLHELFDRVLLLGFDCIERLSIVRDFR